MTAGKNHNHRSCRWSACRKSLFDTLLQVFLHLKSAEKLMIQNERHPSWVSFVTIFLPVAHIFRVYRQSAHWPCRWVSSYNVQRKKHPPALRMYASLNTFAFVSPEPQTLSLSPGKAPSPAAFGLSVKISPDYTQRGWGFCCLSGRSSVPAAADGSFRSVSRSRATASISLIRFS